LIDKIEMQMKQPAKILFWVLVFLLSAENIYTQSLGIHAGRSVLPADYVSLRYTHYSNCPINAAVSVFTERSHSHGLNYSAYGFDLLGEFATNQNEPSVLAFRVGMGGSFQMENEPWLYKDLSFKQRINYGLVGELAGEWWMSGNICLTVFTQQKWLFNKSLGNSRFAYGLGLKILLTND
jgi:hypothetical protein